MSKLEADKGTVLDMNELRERREQVEQLRRARRLVGRAERWDRAWMRWSWRIAVVVALMALSFELGRELVSCSR